MSRENNEDSNSVRHWLMLVYFSFNFLFHPNPTYTCHDLQLKGRDPPKKACLINVSKDLLMLW